MADLIVERLRVSNVWHRAATAFIDGWIVLFIILAAKIVYHVLIALIAISHGFLAGMALEMFWNFLVVGAYHVWFIGTRSATPGKEYMGLYVLSPHREKVNFTTAAVRFVLFYIPFLNLISCVLVLSDTHYHRAIHDRVAETIVFRDYEAPRRTGVFVTMGLCAFLPIFFVVILWYAVANMSGNSRFNPSGMTKELLKRVEEQVSGHKSIMEKDAPVPKNGPSPDRR